MASAAPKLEMHAQQNCKDSCVEYCTCILSATKPLQLIAAVLFPTTIEHPDTAFTFAVLNYFHVHTLASKKSAYDHFVALKKHTNSTFSHESLVHCVIHSFLITDQFLLN
jgi:hypothetical protein